MTAVKLLLTFSQSYFIDSGVCYLVLCEAGFPKKLAFAYLEDLQAEFHEQHGKKVPTVSRPYSFIEFGNGLHFPSVSLTSGHHQFPNTFHQSIDTYIQKTKKSYIDSRARRNMSNINTELQDVQRIMVANIEEVLQRGEALSGKHCLHCTECNSISEWVQSVFEEVEQNIKYFTCSFLLYFSSALDSKASNLSSLSKKYRSDAKYLNTRSTYAKLAAGGVFFIMLIVYVRFWWL